MQGRKRSVSRSERKGHSGRHPGRTSNATARAQREVAAYLFGPGGHRLARISRDEWEWATCLAGGDVAKAASTLGLDVPADVHVLWGRSSREALAGANGRRRRSASPSR